MGHAISSFTRIILVESHAGTCNRETGPVRWIVRVNRHLSSNSSSMIDYCIIPGVDGIGVFIGLDYHETETLVKYEIPYSVDAVYSIAESCYATTKRLNIPVANHDVPRWEKWMHTFVTVESTDGSAGLAVINEENTGLTPATENSEFPS